MIPLRQALLGAALTLSAAQVSQAATVVVNDAGDALHDTGCASTGTGTCTLRDAITFANANGGVVINFALDGQVIRPTSALPPVMNPTVIAGPLSLYGSSSQEIDGSQAGPVDGLVLEGSGCRLVSISIRRFQGTGLVIKGDSNSVGGYLDCGGLLCFDHPTAVAANGGHGIEILGSANVVPYTVIVANGGHGIYIRGGATLNQIGTDDIGFQNFFWYPPNSIGSNGQAGIRIGDGNADVSTRGNTLLGNSIGSNGGLGIDLAGDGPTPNDEGDFDDGPNAFQNHPIVCSASIDPATGDAVIQAGAIGFADGASTFRFFANPTGAAGQAVNFLGATTLPHAYPFFEVRLPPPSTTPWPDPLGTVVATATDANGNTSELGRPAVEPTAMGLSFHTLPPCRAVNTRLPGDGPLVAPRAFTLHGSCGVPASAHAVVANVTVTNATVASHLSFSAGGCPPPTSTLNFTAGQTRANVANLMLDARGRVTAWVPHPGWPGEVDLIIDVTGYWE